MPWHQRQRLMFELNQPLLGRQHGQQLEVLEGVEPFFQMPHMGFEAAAMPLAARGQGEIVPLSMVRSTVHSPGKRTTVATITQQMAKKKGVGLAVSGFYSVGLCLKSQEPLATPDPES